MFGKRVHEMSKPANAVSLSVRCLVGVFLLHNPAATLAQLIQIGEPELVFSMEDFPSIISKNLNCMDVSSDGSMVAICPHGNCGGSAWPYVYQADGQGGDPIRVGLTVGHHTTGAARFSRDGTKLLFEWRETPTADIDIWQVSTDGSNPVELIGGPDHQLFPCPVVVNGQDRIIYRKGWSPFDLWSADMAGGDRIRLTFEGNKHAPRASADGTKVVYMSQASVPIDIFLMNSDGSGQSPITDDGYWPRDAFPALAQNDQGQELIVYSRQNPSAARNEIWITDLLGAQQEVLIAVEDRDLYHVNYVPDDPISPYGALYYTSTPPMSCGVTEVWRVAVSGEEDDCPDSDLNPEIAIDDCETGVENQMLDGGCTMADLIMQCPEDAVNHGAFVRCVSHLTNLWKCQRIIRGGEKGAIMSCAGQADLP